VERRGTVTWHLPAEDLRYYSLKQVAFVGLCPGESNGLLDLVRQSEVELVEGVQPASHEAIVFSFSLDAPENEYVALEKTLNAEEIARADRFLLPQLRWRYVVCRGRLRKIIGAALGLPPAEVNFQYEQWGKPKLAGAAFPALHFNVSHSQGWGLIALARTSLGVDLEIPNDRINYRAIVSQVLSPQERQAWDRLPGRTRDEAVMQLWVCKESLLKAMGLGIAEGLQQVSFPLPLPLEHEFAPERIDPSLQLHLDDDGSCRSNHWIDANAWRMRMLPAAPANSFAAICTSPTVKIITMVDL
jgi:4'-phosphopantetheinyl transferase